jgi:HAD superfamily hydrolase (TIGR01509 family)
MIKALLFDWGNTVMVDFELPGPMFTWEKVAWVEGTEESLRTLSSRYDCYIATNAGQSDRTAVKKGLNRVEADRYFKEIFASSDIGFEKPDQRFFEAIIHTLKLNPEELVMIGDNYTKDIAGARRCGIRTVFLTKHTDQHEYPMADVMISSMSHLCKAIETL